MHQVFTYRFVDVPGYQDLTKLIYKKLPQTLYTKHGFWTVPKAFFNSIPNCKQTVEKFGSWNDISQIALVSSLPTDEFPIHTDLGHTQAFALNFPLYNCDEVYTAFYKSTKQLQDLPVEVTPDAILDIYPTESMVEIDRYYLTQPVIINTSIPHNVINRTSDIRLAITIRWATEVLHENLF